MVIRLKRRGYNFPILSFPECPISEDGMERFACPTADRMGRYHCIDDHALCDGFIDCPTGEDEDRQACMFYKTVSLQLVISRRCIITLLINNTINTPQFLAIIMQYSLSICVIYFLFISYYWTNRIEGMQKCY